MKDCVNFPFSLKNIVFLSFFDVRNLIAVEGLLMFSVPKCELLLFVPIKISASAPYSLSHVELFLVDFFNNFSNWSPLKFLCFLIFHWNMDIYLENSF